MTNDLVIPSHDRRDAIARGGPGDKTSFNPMSELSRSFEIVLKKNLRATATGIQNAIEPVRMMSPDRNPPPIEPEQADFSEDFHFPQDTPLEVRIAEQAYRENEPRAKSPERSSDGRVDEDTARLINEDDDTARLINRETSPETTTKRPSHEEFGENVGVPFEIRGIGANHAGPSVETPMTNMGTMRNSLPTMPVSAGMADAATVATSGHAPAKSTASGQAHSTAASTVANQDADPTGLASSTNRQAADLAKSLGRSSDAKISVTVTDATDTLISRPASTLVAAAAAVTGQKGNSRQGQGQASTSGNGKAGLQIPTTNSSQMTVAAPQIHRAGTQANNPAGNIPNLLQGVTGIGATSQSKGAGVLAPSTVADPVGLGGPNLPAQGSQIALGRTAGMNKPHPTHPPTTQQISVQITKAVKAGIDKIDIQLRPESLGRVEVRLELAGDGRLVGTVTADNRETLDLLKSDARDLERALQDAGLKADSNSLNFNLRGQGNRSLGEDRSNSPERTSEQQDVDVEHEDRIPVRTLDGYSSGMISPDGSVNITT